MYRNYLEVFCFLLVLREKSDYHAVYSNFGKLLHDAVYKNRVYCRYFVTAIVRP